MEKFVIVAEPRESFGKKASRRLRRQGKVPAIVYGGGVADALPIIMNHDDLAHHLEVDAFYSHVLELQVGKTRERVVLKDLQRHAYQPRLLHVDLQRVKEDEKITLRVPLHFVNEASCVGVKQSGGVISRVINELEVSCLPKDLPEYIEVDMADIEVGGGIHLADLKMPAGVEIAALIHGGDASQVVATVHLPKVVAEEEEEEEEVQDQDTGGETEAEEETA